MNRRITIKKEKPVVDEEAPFDQCIDDNIFIRLSLRPKKKRITLEWMEWPELNVIAGCTYTLAEARLLHATLGCHIKELESR